MFLRRRLAGLIVPLGLFSLPACGTGPLLPLRDPDHARLLESVSQTIPQKKEREFGTLPAAPGEVVPLHPHVPLSVVDPIPVRNPDTLEPPPIEPVKENEKKSVPISVESAVPPFVQSMQAFYAGHPEAALDHLKEYDKPNQDLLLQLVPAVVRVSQMNLAHPDAEETATLARTFESAAAALTRRAGLTVKKAVLCLNVDGFGQFTPVRDRTDLRRGYLYPLYVEVGNVPCEPFTRRRDGAEGFQTRLDVSMQVTDDTGRVIEIITDPKTGQSAPKSTASKAEFSLSPIHDYFIAANVQAPSRAGTYTVTFELRDPTGGRVVSHSLSFRVQ